MHRRVMSFTTVILVLSLGFALIVGCAPAPTTPAATTTKPEPTTPAATTTKPEPATATAEQFYRGKTMSIYTGSPGTGIDIMARMLAPLLEKEIGVTLVVENQPGGTAMLNSAYRAKPDGLTLALHNSLTLTMPAWAGQTGVAYEVEKFNWLAEFMLEPSAFLVAPQTPYRSIKDLQQAKGLKVGATTPLGANGVSALLACWVLDLDAVIISGFKGNNDLALATQKGEIDGFGETETGILRYSQAGQGRVLFVYVESKQFPNLEALSKAVKLTDEQKKMLGEFGMSARFLVTNPGVPQDRVDFLRKVLKKILEDKNNQELFVEKVQLGSWGGIVSGEEVQKRVSQPEIGAEVKRVFQSLQQKYIKKL